MSSAPPSASAAFTSKRSPAISVASIRAPAGSVMLVGTAIGDAEVEAKGVAVR